MSSSAERSSWKLSLTGPRALAHRALATATCVAGVLTFSGILLGGFEADDWRMRSLVFMTWLYPLVVAIVAWRARRQPARASLLAGGAAIVVAITLLWVQLEARTPNPFQFGPQIAYLGMILMASLGAMHVVAAPLLAWQERRALESAGLPVARVVR